jgi:FkbM family methyltransferase
MQTLTTGKRLLLDRFSRDLDAIEARVPMLHSYTRVAPYIVQQWQPGGWFEMIIFHEESKAWFDQIKSDQGFVQLKRHNAIREGDVVFDLGCNAGFMSVWYGINVGPTGQVHAFDPFPWNALSTRYNAELNFQHHVRSYGLGISCRDEEVTLSAVDAKISNRDPTIGFAAKIRNLENFAHLDPAVMKIDIEGAEFEVSQCDYDRFPNLRIVILELHGTFMSARGLDPEVCLENFRRQGFAIHLGAIDGPIVRQGVPTINPQYPGHCGLYLVRKCH